MDDFVTFYESDFEMKDSDFIELLHDMHTEFDLMDLKPLLEYAEELEEYEKCIIIKKFQEEYIDKLKKWKIEFGI